jgi:hypothetical protein
MPTTQSIREIVEYGLDAIPLDKQVEVNLRDLVFVFQTLGELNRFFHQPAHFPDHNSVLKFLGSVGEGGGYEVLHEACYRKLRDMLPADVEELIDSSSLQHPEPPTYYFISPEASDQSRGFRPNHSLNRTHNGMPPSGPISFWPSGVLPSRAG